MRRNESHLVSLPELVDPVRDRDHVFGQQPHLVASLQRFGLVHLERDHDQLLALLV
jgi:hypothetical protein